MQYDDLKNVDSMPKIIFGHNLLKSHTDPKKV